ncbi:hypothetical protein O3G_MSEX002404 [Manduca sexta]|uniref:Uncharacterized protein n=1 Tax=Manduca sexta TaxID=7130 RepID=A0A921YN81_MANSE|nr:hypothetical protein O3G_MSEX002404 [Manduca sexta]
MLKFCFLAVLLIQANAQYVCEDEIKTEMLEDYEQLVGNWTFLVGWNNIEDSSEEDDKSGEEINCATMDISETSDDEVQSIRESCKDDFYYDFFDYANAKYKLIAPDLDMEKSLIAVGSQKSILSTCGFIASLEVRKVSDDYMIMINHELGSIFGGLIGKKIPEDDELVCLMYNIDVVKGLNPDAYCDE